MPAKDKTVAFKGNDYGDVTICASSQSASQSQICSGITVNDEVTFNSEELCPADSRCNLQFVLNVNNSNFRCAEKDCRYPDQVRLGITWTKSGSSVYVKSTYILIAAILISRI
ncbi:hypothetical protein WA026_008667 [Henosepilachna vigintioctopunctata]|uniref:Uncharacterized protein n=1 Tax=Henosepilachna vigintioctopunctata TaxID=420089 RepID=A0AAW1VAW6_9CUCU